ncbi:diaminopropionate ammonia-lyase [Deinobacterium chartae]|uniref:Diaminopropionate ammonia-lyase n=1 Tax=Deinobacterium chartae TaxID=521158 RepID=A0A841I3U0_9DEIO|nr:diaminopropionate ammonia-lyase [Deinobacterium chartae]MBB6099983.1 diaminopropionate ammonia-lyase [Deinobacterium chartae]
MPHPVRDTPENPAFYLNPRPQPLEEFLPGAHDPRDFHRQLPGYAPTPLCEAPGIARRLGVAQLWVKDESSRLGLPAYKILGASWATWRALTERLGLAPAASGLEELRARLAGAGPLELVAATDGNHGRAVARVARWLGIGAHILVPQDMSAARVEAIQAEGARVTRVSGSYDDAVEAAARQQGPSRVVIADTAWPGYERVPGWVVDGYATLFLEADAALAAAGAPPPDLVLVQVGVGSLAAAAVKHYRRPAGHTRVVAVEPTRAACLLESLRAGRLTEVPGPHDSVMAGLNCGRPSPLAWPLLQRSLHAAVAIPDRRTEQAVRLLAGEGIRSGESGAAALGGLLELLEGPWAERARSALEIGPQTRVLVISTEGPTDPAAYARSLGPEQGR